MVVGAGPTPPSRAAPVVSGGGHGPPQTVDGSDEGHGPHDAVGNGGEGHGPHGAAGGLGQAPHIIDVTTDDENNDDD